MGRNGFGPPEFKVVSLWFEFWSAVRGAGNARPRSRPDRDGSRLRQRSVANRTSLPSGMMMAWPAYA